MGVPYDHGGGHEGNEGHVNYDWHWGDDLWGNSDDNFFAIAGGHNTVHGQGGDDEIHVKGHADFVDGGRGDDEIWLKGPYSTAVGGSGDDEIHVKGHHDSVAGGRGDDEIWAKGHHNTVAGGSGDDEIHVKGNHNQVDGGRGDDEIWAKGNHNTVAGGSGDDDIHVKGHHDSVAGGRGDDEIHSQGSHNTLYGGDGNDTIGSHGHHDKVDGGDGFDVVVYDHSKPHNFTYDEATNTYNWGGLGTAKNVEFQQFEDGVQITVHNTSEAAIARMFHFATGSDPTASEYKSALDLLQGGKSITDVVKETFGDLDHHTAGDTAGNTQFVQDLFHNAGENLTGAELNHLAGHLNQGDFTKAELLSWLSQTWTSHDEQLGIHIDQTFK